MQIAKNAINRLVEAKQREKSKAKIRKADFTETDFPEEKQGNRKSFGGLIFPSLQEQVQIFRSDIPENFRSCLLQASRIPKHSLGNFPNN